jgi:stage II sporulation protein GA (sporulation sigma-E factor processing peptidase)
MTLYLDVLMGVEFLVDLLLLIGADRLSGHRSVHRRYLTAAGIGAVYGGLCVKPGLGVFSGAVGRVAVLGVMGLTAYAGHGDWIRRCVLFALLSMALGGAVVCLQRPGIWALILSAATLCALCVFGFRGRIGARYLPVRIRDRGEDLRFTALVDTGNTLTDPVTGRPVLVVSGSIGRKLTGLTVRELEDPASAVLRCSAIRLIPYSVIGKEGGVLAAKRFEDVTVGRWKGSLLVAFAPNEVGAGRPYDALTGVIG